MNKDNATNWLILAFVLGSICLGYLIAVSPDSGLGFIIGTVPVVISLLIINREKDDRAFLLRLYLITLCVRWALAVFIYSESLQPFFGGDAETYDIVGYVLSRAWSGFGQADSPWMIRYTASVRGRPISSGKPAPSSRASPPPATRPMLTAAPTTSGAAGAA